MSPSRRPSRRVPPKSRGPRPAPPPPMSEGTSGASPTPEAAPSSPVTPVAPMRPMGTRSANRAAKRAASPVRAKTGLRTGSRGKSNNNAVVAVAIGAAALAVAVILIANPFGGGAGSSPSPGPSAVVYGDGTCPTAQPASLTATDVKTVTITTSKGTIVIKIDGARAPIATGNFVALAKCHYYDGVVFHRLVPGFVIQGGDPEGTGQGGPGYAIKDDPLTTTYKRGTVAMARSSGPNTQGSQFFIVLADDANTSLVSSQYPYAILGEVTSGMDVVDAIAAMPNSGSSSGNSALDPVAMISVTVTDGPPGASTAPTAAPTASPAATAPASVAPASIAPSTPTQ